ncbi:MAG TPA: hypothetical protein VFS44_11285 [Gemmatimonadaceae bacterium]|nr:hypothetical protein [Gemmatimonadaceae bacterium]
MRSRADTLRATLEWLLRAGVIALLAWFLVYTLRTQREGVVEDAASPTLDRQLARWSTSSSPSRVQVRLDHPPAGRDRDWLGALTGAGTAVAWSGPKLVPTAIAIEPRADPQRGVDVSVAAPESATVVLADTLGVLDSARATRDGVRGYIPKPRATVDAIVGPVAARAARHDSLELRRLFVVGEAGWEGKFTIAALEERGWKVDAHLAVSPKGDTHQGKLAELDTAHYSAVLALDSTAARYAGRIASFVREGGGLVLWSPAARVRALAAIAPGGAGTVVEDEGDTPPDSAPRSALEITPITSLAPDAVVLERRGDAVTLAARRVGPGRVIETGYTDSWRWRMAGGPDALERHRAWISGLVSLVAFAPHHPLAAVPSDAAPLASLIDRLGAPSTTVTRASLDPAVVARWVFGILCAALLVEWASRRLRGVK